MAGLPIAKKQVVSCDYCGVVMPHDQLKNHLVICPGRNRKTNLAQILENMLGRQQSNKGIRKINKKNQRLNAQVMRNNPTENQKLSARSEIPINANLNPKQKQKASWNPHLTTDSPNGRAIPDGSNKARGGECNLT